MKAVIQRVSHSSVTIDNKIVAEIQRGLLILIGIEEADSREDIVWLTSKIANLRIFADAATEAHKIDQGMQDCVRQGSR